MANIITPLSQDKFIHPYSQRLFSFNNVDSRVYLARTVNHLYKTFGENVILDGLNISSIVYDTGLNIITVNISPGKCLIDFTMIEFTEGSTLDIDASGLDDSGKLVVSVRFTFTDSVHPSLANLRLSYLTNTNVIVSGDNWDPYYDSLILGVIGFNTTEQTTTDMSGSILNDNDIIINGGTYIIRPMNNISKQMRETVLQTFTL